MGNSRPLPVAQPPDADGVGEFELIARLTVGVPTRPDVVAGIGDDAALLALDPSSPWLLVATVDSQIEGRHFLRDIATPEDIGHKALAVNLSDLAAMGAEPLWALISLVLPPGAEPADLERIYAGLRALAARYGVAIVGGNVAAQARAGTLPLRQWPPSTHPEGAPNPAATLREPLVLDVTALGRVTRGHETLRAGGQPGDALLVTGSLGAAAAGLLALVTEPDAARLASDMLSLARTALVAPVPRVMEGRTLAATGHVHAMLDISDGLAADLAHLCAASDCGVLLDAAAIPVSPVARAIADAYDRDALDLALHGGEDYELLFATAPDSVEAMRDAVARCGSTAQVIGTLTARDAGLRIRWPDGTIGPLEARGWDHLL
jgi:thiamine-monophosphate kinase